MGGNTACCIPSTNTPDGALPTGVVLSAEGKLYGTTIGGGKLALGTAFEVTP